MKGLKIYSGSMEFFVHYINRLYIIILYFYSHTYCLDPKYKAYYLRIAHGKDLVVNILQLTLSLV